MEYQASDPAVLLTHLQKFYDNERLSDLKVTCGHREWNAHLIVVCANSGLFHGEYGFRSGVAVEKALAPLDDEVDTVEAMVYYLYHGTYSAPATVKPAFADAEHFHFDVYVIGERYNVRGLCSLAFDNFLKYIRANWNDEDFGFIIGIIYTNQSERSPTLYQRARQAVVELAKEHAAELFALKPHYDHLQEVARITPEFMFDLLQELNGVRLDLLRLPDMGICSRANNKPCKNCKGWFGESEMKCGDDGDYFCLRCHRRLAYYSKVPAA